MKNPGQVGANFERRCRLILIDQYGYRATRSSGSLGPYDLDAEKALPPELAAYWGRGTQRLLVQAKYTGRGAAGIPYVPPAEWNVLYELALQRGALGVLVGRPAPRKPPQWWLMTGPKSGRQSVRTPCVPFDPASFLALPGERPLPEAHPLGLAM